MRRRQHLLQVIEQKFSYSKFSLSPTLPPYLCPTLCVVGRCACAPRLGVLIKRIMFWYNKSLTTERQRGRHIYLHAPSTNILSQPPLSLASALRIYFQLHFANGEENASHNSAPTIGPDMTHTHTHTDTPYI